MDFTLIPICSENGHTMSNKINCHNFCDICYKGGVHYKCNDCEENWCKSCHRENKKLEREKSKKKRPPREKGLSISQNFRDIKLAAQDKLDSDNLTDWRIKFTGEEIYYYNVVTKSFTYDYPIVSEPPISPKGGGDLEMGGVYLDSELIANTPKVRNRASSGVCDIYNNMKGRILGLNLY